MKKLNKKLTQSAQSAMEESIRQMFSPKRHKSRIYSPNKPLALGLIETSKIREKFLNKKFAK